MKHLGHETGQRLGDSRDAFAVIRALVPVPTVKPPAGIEAPKTGILDGVAADQAHLRDPNAKAMSQTWWRDRKAFEPAFAAA